MQKLLACANRVIQALNWKDMALVKFCLCSIGVLIGLSIPAKKRKLPMIAAGVVFLATYIPLMFKIIPQFCHLWKESDEF
ncbi:MAG: permease of phosphate ABC transporter [Candidatus Merdivicinus sp.]|jgi:hypothetical protein